MTPFKKENIISPEFFRKITDIRVGNPEFVLGTAQSRRQRKTFTTSGKLNVVAADHPARGSLGVGDNPFAMADRHELLARLVYVLQSQWLDGVLGSMDLLEELIILHGLMKRDGKGLLDDKLLIASLNRGGHPGSVWELHDPITGTSANICCQMKLDAAKMLLRMDPASRGSLQTLMDCVEGVNQMSKAKLPIFLEPLPVKKQDNRYKVIKDADLVVQITTITAALGRISRYTWLKLPFIKDFKRAANATTLPIVLLGGDRSSDVKKLLVDLDKALSSGHQVRGAMFGRNLLYPESVDPFELADAIGKIIHCKSSPKKLVKELESA
jgi:hypothetical protein